MHTSSNAIIGHVELRTSNLDLALNYYQKLLGFRLIQQTNDKAYLSAAGTFPAQIVLKLLPEATDKPYRTTGLYHLAIRLPNRREMALLLKRMLDNNISLLGLSDHTVSEAIYLNDPDENGIEIYCDRPREQWSLDGTKINMSAKHLSPKDLLIELQNKENWIGMHPEAAIGHIHLQVSDLAACEDFYNKILGLNITQKNHPGALFFAAGDYHHHIACNTWSSKGAPPPPENTVGMEEFSIVFPDRLLLMAALNRAVDSGLLSSNEIDPEVNTFRICDPSGNRILLTI